jgi:hypothetical protein
MNALLMNGSCALSVFNKFNILNKKKLLDANGQGGVTSLRKPNSEK